MIISDVTLAVAKAMKFEGEDDFDTNKAADQFKRAIGNNQLRMYLQEYKFTTMEDEFKKAINCSVENFEVTRK